LNMKSERAPMSPSERAALIRRCARAIAKGQSPHALIKRKTYSEKEVREAMQMLRTAGEGRQ